MTRRVPLSSKSLCQRSFYLWMLSGALDAHTDPELLELAAIADRLRFACAARNSAEFSARRGSSLAIARSSAFSSLSCTAQVRFVTLLSFLRHRFRLRTSRPYVDGHARFYDAAILLITCLIWRSSLAFTSLRTNGSLSLLP
jgi:hypothetical protein